MKKKKINKCQSSFCFVVLGEFLLEYSLVDCRCQAVRKPSSPRGGHLEIFQLTIPAEIQIAASIESKETAFRFQTQA
jgi:hypothetical protein